MGKYFGLCTAPFSNCGPRDIGGPWRYAEGIGRKKALTKIVQDSKLMINKPTHVCSKTAFDG
jgi:hypothetical protein